MPAYYILSGDAMPKSPSPVLSTVRTAFVSCSRAAVCALMVTAVVRLCKSNVRDWFGLALAAAAFVLTVVIDISPVFPVLGAAILGIFAGMFTERGGKQ